MNNQTRYSIFIAAIPFIFLPTASASAQSRLDEVVITASRIETPVRQVGAAVSVIDQKEIALRGFESLAELLRSQPSIAVSNAGGQGKPTALRIRGEEGYRTLVMIDGVDISDPTATQVGPLVQYVPTGADIQKVEILRGPQGFIYGADAGGVVNVFTRDTQNFASEIVADFGRYNTQHLQGFFADGNEKMSGSISANRQSTDGFNAGVKDTSNEPDGFENSVIHVKGRVNLNENWHAQLVARNADAEGRYDGCGFDRSNHCSDDYSQTIAKLTLAYDTEALTQSFAVAQTRNDRANMTNGKLGYATDGTIKKIEYLGRYLINPFLTMVWGGDQKAEEITGIGGETGNRDQLGHYAEAQTQFDHRFYFSAGARADNSDDFGDHVSTRIAPAFIQEISPESSIKYRASWGTGFRAPSLSEIFYNKSADAFLPALGLILHEENSEGYDLGVEWYNTAGYSVQLGVFDQKIENEIFFDLVKYSGYLQEKGVSHSRGAEISFEIPVFVNLLIDGNYTYNETLTNDETVRIRRPKNLANLGFLTNALNNQLHFMVHLRVARDAVNEIFGVGRVPLDDYEVIDVHVQYQPTTKLTYSAHIENLTDRHYQEINDYNTSGRALTLGAKYSF